MTDKRESALEIQRWLEQQIQGLGPLALGSLTYRKSPCVRKRCRACESGEGHRSFVFYARERNGKKRSVYIPAVLAEEIERALENGRLLQELLYEAGARYVEALKRERKDRR